MKSLNFAELTHMADQNGQPRATVYIAAIVQRIFGSLNNLLLILMLLVSTGPVILIMGAIIGAISLVALATMLPLSISVFAMLFIEYLYCSKDSSFSEEFSQAEKALCPDKNRQHRNAQLAETEAEIQDSFRL